MAFNDIFVEQIVPIKNNAKKVTIKMALWTVASLLSVGLIVLAIFKTVLAFVFLLLAAAILFGAHYLCGQLNVEYEYIITNGEIDIDRIVNKSKRHRMATFNCASVEKIEKFDSIKHKANNDKDKRIYHACTPTSDAYSITVRHPKGGVYTVVIIPDERFKEAMKKYLSYNLKSCI